MNRDHRDYLIALLCLALIGGCVFLYLVLTESPTETGWQALSRLVVKILPSAIVALLAFPLVFFFLRQKGVLDGGATGAEPTGGMGVEHAASRGPASSEEYGWAGTISWEDACNAVGRLCDQILREGYNFDCVVSPTDGGLIVADLLVFCRKFRADRDLQIPIICLNLSRQFNPTKTIQVESTSYPIEYARRFEKVLVVDEASRSGKTMDAVIQSIKHIYHERGLEIPEIRGAVLGSLLGHSGYVSYSELDLAGAETYPWGPFAEHWEGRHPQ